MRVTCVREGTHVGWGWLRKGLRDEEERALLPPKSFRGQGVTYKIKESSDLKCFPMNFRRLDLNLQM